VDLTAPQRRTLERLIGTGPAPSVDPEVADRVRDDLERRLAAAGVEPQGDPIWLGKHRLVDRERCEGLFLAGLRREGTFEHSARTAVGALLHKAMELDVATERALDPYSLAERAAIRRGDQDASFQAYWTGLDEVARGEVVVDAAKKVAQFRDGFPPLERRWAAQPELSFRASLAGGRVVLSGSPDLVLGRGRRLVVDFKTGSAWPEYAEDGRFYALLVLLRTGVPPYRVATFFLDSGEWQAEDVSDDTLARAADRVLEGAVAAAELAGGRPPELRPGTWCGWCVRRDRCPALRSRQAS
jgi:hypothetical protein